MTNNIFHLPRGPVANRHTIDELKRKKLPTKREGERETRASNL